MCILYNNITFITNVIWYDFFNQCEMSLKCQLCCLTLRKEIVLHHHLLMSSVCIEQEPPGDSSWNMDETVLHLLKTPHPLVMAWHHNNHMCISVYEIFNLKLTQIILENLFTLIHLYRFIYKTFLHLDYLIFCVVPYFMIEILQMYVFKIVSAV